MVGDSPFSYPPLGFSKELKMYYSEVEVIVYVVPLGYSMTPINENN